MPTPAQTNESLPFNRDDPLPAHPKSPGTGGSADGAGTMRDADCEQELPVWQEPHANFPDSKDGKTIAAYLPG